MGKILVTNDATNSKGILESPRRRARIMTARRRCHVSIPSKTLATKSNRSCQKGGKSSRCFLLSQALGSHWHFHCPGSRVRTETRVNYQFKSLCRKLISR